MGLLDRTHLRFFTRADIDDMLLSTGFIPSLWDRNIVPEEDTEYGERWLSLPLQLRQALEYSAEGQTYQFIVKAYPSTEPGWVAHSQASLAAVQLRCDELVGERTKIQLELDETIAALREHQKAFAEARTLIAERDASLKQLQSSLDEVSQQLQSNLDEVSQQAGAGKC